MRDYRDNHTEANKNNISQNPRPTPRGIYAILEYIYTNKTHETRARAEDLFNICHIFIHADTLYETQTHSHVQH